MNVLIVEDSPTVRRMLGSVVQSCGCDVTEAVSGEEAWQVLQSDDAPRIVLLDYVLPGMNGSELCRKIRGQTGKRYVYVILVSVKADRETKSECMDAGVDDYVVKSCDPEELEQRLRVARRILQLYDQLHETIQHREEFLAMISHELRNPVGAILNAVEALRQVNAQSVEEHEVIHRQITHIARLLDDLLDVARIQQNKIEFHKQAIDLMALTDEVLEAMQHQFEAKDQCLHVARRDGPLPVFGDPVRLKQAQVNLLTNASKYTPPGGDVWYAIERNGESVVITVRDSGDGIPGELLDNVFNLFVQLDATLDRSSGGMGVGLSVAQGIIEAHKGRILAASDGAGRGSTFQIRLPLTDHPLTAQVPARRYSFFGCKLLLVEDNDDARTMLAKALRHRGFEVADTRDGQTALQLFRSFRPDVAIIDIGLPIMNGYQVARETRNIDGSAETMLIALTGYGRDEDRRAAVEAGFDAHFVKPLNPDELYELIATRFTSQAST